MTFIQDRVVAGEVITGCFCTMGSTVSVEIAGHAGFDFLVLDIEHGAGDLETLYGQLQVAAGTPVAAVVRVAWNEAPRFKRALDAGADGIMVPYVQTPEEAAAAVAAMRYPPAGIRGVASSVRAARFGADFAAYRAGSDDGLLTILQIETAEGVAAAGEIAAVDGADVLFVGPNDLSFSLGIPQQFDHPDFTGALDRVADGARAAGKAAGILLQTPDQVAPAIERGYTFIALGSDGSYVAGAAKAAFAALAPYRTAGED